MELIKRATVQDAEIIAEKAKSIYQEHYLHLWNAGGAYWYMNDYAYALEKIKADLQNLNVEYYLLFCNDDIAGYLKLIIDAKFDENTIENSLEIERIYLHKKYLRNGFGKQLMQLAFDKAIILKKQSVFLKAMDTSTDAIGFYKRMGFEVIGKFSLPMPTFSLMKPEYRGMVIFKKHL